MKSKVFIIIGIMLLLSVALLAKELDELYRFDISPNPMKDKCEIALAYNGVTDISIVIISEKGDIVKTVYSGILDKTGFYSWDRTDTNGNLAQAGTYVVEVRFHSRYTSTKKTLILK
ncbi:MAG: hypothetical protein PHY41_05665 [Candidatus Cloacimonetes bacterium]|jgi:hypothetical protein|nr:hypothetical protein [Candidatus Cloacimonadota bacterium]MDY0298875.1 hypothetical protein [Candidatus Cloacimonadaceae bacterium]MCB5277934.1 hypothetical protein [Candidatus Cloacimonadota bacterium]MCK9332150.1 hypothetical protein [Candidatus Cloacimonadota bacterium]MDD2210377.1 hypothetical protein [Candidatus Cloacimonadota bacterium]